MDQDLNLINGRSLGISGTTLTCNSIQVTRSADYIYLGGTIYTTKSALFFVKLDANADTMVYTSLTYSSSDMGLKRIMLESQKPYQSSSDNARLYFCGYLSSSKSLLYGHVTSTSLTTIAVSLIFNFGPSSTPSSQIGFSSSTENPDGKCDCQLTEDNAYMLAVFSTNFQNSNSVGWNSQLQWYTYYY